MSWAPSVKDLKRVSNKAQLRTKPGQLLQKLEDWRENQNLVFNSTKNKKKKKNKEIKTSLLA